MVPDASLRLIVLGASRPDGADLVGLTSVVHGATCWPYTSEPRTVTHVHSGVTADRAGG